MPLIEIRISLKRDDDEITMLDRIEGHSVIEIANKFTIACIQMLELLKPHHDIIDDDIPF